MVAKAPSFSKVPIFYRLWNASLYVKCLFDSQRVSEWPPTALRYKLHVLALQCQSRLAMCPGHDRKNLRQLWPLPLPYKERGFVTKIELKISSWPHHLSLSNWLCLAYSYLYHFSPFETHLFGAAALGLQVPTWLHSKYSTSKFPSISQKGVKNVDSRLVILKKELY